MCDCLHSLTLSFLTLNIEIKLNIAIIEWFKTNCSEEIVDNAYFRVSLYYFPQENVKSETEFKLSSGIGKLDIGISVLVIGTINIGFNCIA